VLCFIENGRTTKEIARELGISPKTVEYHRSHLMQKFEANNVAELVHKARLPGLAGQVPAAVPTPAD
jgi:DNA-binding CsgD family transcriptional regulator